MAGAVQLLRLLVLRRGCRRRSGRCRRGRRGHHTDTYGIPMREMGRNGRRREVDRVRLAGSGPVTDVHLRLAYTSTGFCFVLRVGRRRFQRRRRQNRRRLVKSIVGVGLVVLGFGFLVVRRVAFEPRRRYLRRADLRLRKLAQRGAGGDLCEPDACGGREREADERDGEGATSQLVEVSAHYALVARARPNLRWAVPRERDQRESRRTFSPRTSSS